MNDDVLYSAVTPPPRVRLSDTIAGQVERLIVEGRLRAGETLPAERVLAQKFGVSRPSLREALLKLEARGLLRAQRSGRFSVTDMSARTITDPLLHLLRSHPRVESDVLEMRHGLEMVAAQFAAERATAADRKRLREAFDRMVKTGGKRDTLAHADADAAFHLAIAEASHNVALIHVMRGIYNLMRTGMQRAWEVLYREPENVRMLHDQHRGMLDAVIAADAARARQAAHLHLSYIRQSLQQIEAPNTRVAPHRRTRKV